MIYLIKSSGYREENGKGIRFPLLKIGYTEDAKTKDFFNIKCTILPVRYYLKSMVEIQI